MIRTRSTKRTGKNGLKFPCKRAGVITSQALTSINKHRYEVPAQIIKTATHACMKVAAFLFW